MSKSSRRGKHGLRQQIGEEVRRVVGARPSFLKTEARSHGKSTRKRNRKALRKMRGLL